MAEGIKLVDDQVAKQRTRRVKTGTGKNATVQETTVAGPVPQVALVALDPHTGEVLALVGGRNYGFSQLNHANSQASDGLHIQAVRLRCGDEFGTDGAGD